SSTSRAEPAPKKPDRRSCHPERSEGSSIEAPGSRFLRASLPRNDKGGSRDSMIRRFKVGQPSAGTRLDLYLASVCSDLSRSRIQKLIGEGPVRVSGAPARRSNSVRSGDDVSIEVPEPKPTAIEAEDIPLTVLYEDEHLLAIDKPPGLVVHPSPGHDAGTLVN